MNLREEDLGAASWPKGLSEDVDAVALLVAAGRSTRIPSQVPKQFLRFEGRAVVAWAASCLEGCSRVTGILPVYPPGMETQMAEALAPAELNKLLPGVPGGASRQESVALGLEALPQGPEIVLIHDGARPLASVALVDRVFEAAVRHGAAIPVRPLVETVKEVVCEQVVRTLERERLYVSQTPQGFRRSVLLEAVRQGREDGVVATDEAMLVERLGGTVATVGGEGRNLKITEPQDLALAEFLLQNLSEQ